MSGVVSVKQFYAELKKIVNLPDRCFAFSITGSVYTPLRIQVEYYPDEPEQSLETASKTYELIEVDANKQA